MNSVFIVTEELINGGHDLVETRIHGVYTSRDSAETCRSKIAQVRLKQKQEENQARYQMYLDNPKLAQEILNEWRRREAERPDDNWGDVRPSHPDFLRYYALQEKSTTLNAYLAGVSITEHQLDAEPSLDYVAPDLV